MTNQTKYAMWELSDRLYWAQEQEWMIQEWLMNTRPNDFPSDRRYQESKARYKGLRMAQREAEAMSRSHYALEPSHRA